MIRILMLGLGDTLVQGDQTLPGSRESLRDLKEFETADLERSKPPTPTVG